MRGNKAMAKQKTQTKIQRTTKNLKAIMNFLENSHCPVSIDEIYIALKNENPALSLSTVYRIIDKLEKDNIVNKITTLRGKKSLYDLAHTHHSHYMVCSECNKMIPLEYCPIENFNCDVVQKSGFNVTGHRFEIYGQCRECINKKGC